MLVRRISNAAAGWVGGGHKRRRPSQPEVQRPGLGLAPGPKSSSLEVQQKKALPPLPTPSDVGRRLPSVQHLLKNRQEVMTRYQGSRAARFRVGTAGGDTPVASLGRLYQFVVIGWNTQAEAEVKYFWEQGDWRLEDLGEGDVLCEDLQGRRDAVRKGVMVVLIRMLCADFNALLRKGAKRGGGDAVVVVVDGGIQPPLPQEPGEEEDGLEKLPEWVKRFGRVYPHEWVHLPDVQGYPTLGDPGLSKEFMEAGILVREPRFRLGLLGVQ